MRATILIGTRFTIFFLLHSLNFDYILDGRVCVNDVAGFGFFWFSFSGFGDFILINTRA